MTGHTNTPAPLWTAEHIASRLGISLAIYQKLPIGAKEIAAVRQAGISRVEVLLKPGHFDCRDLHQVTQVLGECQKQGVRIVSVHGQIKLPYLSVEKQARDIVVRESLSAIRFAEEAGASIFVGHFGRTEHAKGIVTEILSRTDASGVRLTTETFGKLGPYLTLVDDVGSDRFGITVDIGHIRDAGGVNPFTQKEKARPALAQCGGRVLHVHLHESFDLKQSPDHRPPLHENGIIEWGEVFAALGDIGYNGELLFEDGRGEMPDEWLRMTAEFPGAFVRRYGVG